MVFLTDAEKKHFRLVSGQPNLDESQRRLLGRSPLPSNCLKAPCSFSFVILNPFEVNTSALFAPLMGLRAPRGRDLVCGLQRSPITSRGADTQPAFNSYLRDEKLCKRALLSLPQPPSTTSVLTSRLSWPMAGVSSALGKAPTAGPQAEKYVCPLTLPAGWMQNHQSSGHWRHRTLNTPAFTAGAVTSIRDSVCREAWSLP